jgi:hypothetical protein
MVRAWTKGSKYLVLKDAVAFRAPGCIQGFGVTKWSSNVAPMLNTSTANEDMKQSNKNIKLQISESGLFCVTTTLMPSPVAAVNTSCA